MTVTVGLFDATWERLRERIEALGLDIAVRTFDRDGNFDVDGTIVPPSEVDLGYLWLAPDLAGGDFGNLPFEVALACRKVEVLQTFNAGLDNPAYRQIADRGVRICNSSAQSVAIAEYVMAHALGLIHPLDEQRSLQASGTWKRTPFREVANTTWLIVGFGPIGRETARRVKAFDATVNVIRRSREAPATVDAVGTIADLPRFLPGADVIVLACALNPETRRFAGESFFSSVKRGAILVNVARGALIVDDALIAALDRGQLSSAVLDVFDPEPLPADNPLWRHPNVHLTAHTSFAGDGTRARWDALFLDNLPRHVRGEPLVNEVNPDDIA